MAGENSVFQVHHGLPQKVASNAVIQFLASRKNPTGNILFDIESRNNLIALLNNSALSARTGVPRHASSHEALRTATDEYLTRAGLDTFDGTRSVLEFAKEGNPVAIQRLIKAAEDVRDVSIFSTIKGWLPITGAATPGDAGRRRGGGNA